MILDLQNILSDAQSLVQAAGSYLSTNTIDLGANGTTFNGGTPQSDPGKSELELLIQIVTTCTSGGAATVQVQLVMADDAALTSNLTVLAESAAIGYATLVAGYQFRVGAVLPGVTKRYLGVRYVIGTAAITAGAVTAAVVIDKQTNSFVG